MREYDDLEAMIHTHAHTHTHKPAPQSAQEPQPKDGAVGCWSRCFRPLGVSENRGALFGRPFKGIRFYLPGKKVYSYQWWVWAFGFVQSAHAPTPLAPTPLELKTEMKVGLFEGIVASGGDRGPLKLCPIAGRRNKLPSSG